MTLRSQHAISSSQKDIYWYQCYQRPYQIIMEKRSEECQLWNKWTQWHLLISTLIHIYLHKIKALLMLWKGVTLGQKRRSNASLLSTNTYMYMNKINFRCILYAVKRPAKFHLSLCLLLTLKTRCIKLHETYCLIEACKIHT